MPAVPLPGGTPVTPTGPPPGGTPVPGHRTHSFVATRTQGLLTASDEYVPRRRPSRCPTPEYEDPALIFGNVVSL
ncbi:hypothetical protein [Streptomyces sp. NPDC047000]|uniref:hypothetical protein n=1 Tax=Streptomyces sp. NPDC047000 TaxID=3155474 RepID=UPI0033FCAFBD